LQGYENADSAPHGSLRAEFLEAFALLKDKKGKKKKEMKLNFSKFPENCAQKRTESPSEKGISLHFSGPCGVRFFTYFI